MTTYRVDILPFATQEVPGAQATFQGGFDEWCSFVYCAFLLRSDSHVLLVDCGMDDPTRFNEFLDVTVGPRGRVSMSPQGGVISQLAALGVRPEDVDAIAITHLHADHVWNLELFPDAAWVLPATAWEALSELRTARPEMVVDPLYPSWLLDDFAAKAVLADGVVHDSLPGIRIRHVGGHTVDCTAYIAPTSVGDVVFPSDTVWTYKTLEQRKPPGANVNLRDCLDAIDWVAQAGDIVLPSHDPDLLVRHPGGVIGA